MVNYNILWSFLIIKGQLQHIAISSTCLRSVLTIKGQLQHVMTITKHPVSYIGFNWIRSCCSICPITLYIDHIGGVMIIVLSSCVVDLVLEYLSVKPRTMNLIFADYMQDEQHFEVIEKIGCLSISIMCPSAVIMIRYTYIYALL